MDIKKLRLKKGWSQQQLAELSGLSIRTIQRIEGGQNAGLESMKALASVFEVALEELTGDSVDDEIGRQQEQQAVEYVRDLKGFYSHLISYLGTMVILLAINLITAFGDFWVISVAAGWGLGLIAHGVSVFELVDLGPGWEKKQIEKRLKR